jgi:hypothetical protein
VKGFALQRLPSRTRVCGKTGEGLYPCRYLAGHAGPCEERARIDIDYKELELRVAATLINGRKP